MALAKNEVLHCNDSKSLWNYTLSPGWTAKEVEIFRAALMKFGLGAWTKIVKSRCLPGKTVAQLNNQMQRMIGQQSTGEFRDCHIDPANIFAYNKNRPGRRKNGCLVNTGDKITQEEVKARRKENQRKWGLTKEQIAAVVIPKLSKADSSNVVVKSNVSTEASRRREKYDKLRALEEQLQALETTLENKKAKKETPEEDVPVDVEVESKEETVETKAEETAEPKAKAKTKRKSTGKRKQTKKEKTQEELDMEYARKLQRELDPDALPDSDQEEEDFVPTKSKRGRRKKK